MKYLLRTSGALLACAFTLALSACSDGTVGGSSADAMPAASPSGSVKSPDWAGYVRLPGLDQYCSAAISAAPAEYDTAMQWIPCTDGQAGCELLKWQGVLSSSLDTYLFPIMEGSLLSGVVARPDDFGEVVAFDLPSGKARFAIRNQGYTVNAAGKAPTASASITSECASGLLGGTTGAWVLASSKEGGRQILWFKNGEETPSQAWQLPIEGNIDGLANSDQLVALSQTDGRLFFVDKSQSTAASMYGPGRRLWPRHVFGSTVLLATTAEHKSGINPVQEQAYVYKDGVFTDLGITGLFIESDGSRLAWLTMNAGVGLSETVSLWTAPFSSDPAAIMAGKQKVVDIPIGFSGVTELQALRLSDGFAAVALSLVDTDLTVVDLNKGTTSTRKLKAPGDFLYELPLLTNNQAWFVGQSIIDLHTERFTFTAP